MFLNQYIIEPFFVQKLLDLRMEFDSGIGPTCLIIYFGQGHGS